MKLLIENYLEELILELNPAYEKHRKWQEMQKRLHREKFGKEPSEYSLDFSQLPSEKVKLVQSVIEYLGHFMNLDNGRKKIIMNKISSFDPDQIYWLKGYMNMGQNGFHDVKEFVLGGFQE